MRMYKPEGIASNTAYKYSIDKIRLALEKSRVLEGIIICCNDNGELKVELGVSYTDDKKLYINGYMDYSEYEYKPKDVTDEHKINILKHKVGSTVCFKIAKINEINLDTNEIRVDISRKKAQEECIEYYINGLTSGEIVDAKVVNTEDYGVFCDIGCGIVALLPIENICVARIVDINKEFTSRKIKAIVESTYDDNKELRIRLTHKELLGTWDEEVDKFKVGDTVIAKVCALKDYGAFIRLTPNLSGLCEINDCDKKDILVGDMVTVEITGISKDKAKIKLNIINKLEKDRYGSNSELGYFKYTKLSGRVDDWVYNYRNSKLKKTFNKTNK